MNSSSDRWLLRMRERDAAMGEQDEQAMILACARARLSPICYLTSITLHLYHNAELSPSHVQACIREVLEPALDRLVIA